MLVARTRSAIRLRASRDGREVELSSCSPISAFVAGVKIGSDKRSAFASPGGNATPQIAPVVCSPSSPSPRGSRHDRFDRHGLRRRTTIARPRT